MTVLTESIGLIAGCLTTVAFLPQVWQVWRTRSTRDISLIMYLILCTGITLWLVYGLMIGALPVILANALTLLLALAILTMKILWESPRTDG